MEDKYFFMEFSSTEEEKSSFEEIKEDKTLSYSSIVLISICAFYIRKTVKKISDIIFQEKKHPSPYNMYMREKEKLGGKDADRLELFRTLTEKGILSRIFYSIGTEHPFPVKTFLEFFSGGILIREQEKEKTSILISIDSRGKVLHHSLYLPQRVFKALESIWVVSREEEEDEFTEEDKSFPRTPPISKKEASLHPLYTIDKKHKRSIIYPKGVGWIDTVKSIDKKNKKGSSSGKSAAQISRDARIYPISHLIKLLTLSEAYRRNKKVEKNTKPYRILPPTKMYPEGIPLYAPWQLVPLSASPEKTIIIKAEDIPTDAVYLIETERIKYYGVEELGDVPYIGERYNHIMKTSEKIYEGLLIKKKALEENFAEIKKHILNNMIKDLLFRNRTLIMNIKIFAKEATNYLNVLEQLKKQE